jgi:hypothetical protein
MTTSCAFNTFTQSLPSVWSLPSTLEGGKNHNSAKTSKDPKFMSDQLLTTMSKLFHKLILTHNPNTHYGKKLTKCKSVCLLSRSQHDTPMYEAGESRYPKFQQYVDGCCVLGY